MTAETADASGAVTRPDAVGFAAWYAAIFLTLAASLSTVDRQILALMIGPIKHDFALSDSQIGLLAGVAFTLLYSFATIPAAWLADRGSRRIVIGAGMLFWSLMTAVCGLAHQFSTLFLARMGVGVGESALAPSSYSILSDLFPKRSLTTAVGLINTAPFLGLGIANVVGGPVIAHFEAAPPVILPVLGLMRSWQILFLLLGIPGVVLALIGLLTLSEPARRGRASKSEEAPLSLDQLLAFLRSRGKFLSLHFIAYIALSIQGWGLFFWIVEFLVRQRGLTRAAAGLDFGTMAFALGLIGSIFAGQLATRLAGRAGADLTLRMVFWAVLVLGPLAILMPLVPQAWQTLALMVPILFLMAWPGGLGLSALQFVAPNELKGRIIALYMVVVNCVSLALGPYLGGLISDHVFAGKSLGNSLSLMAAINYPVAALCLWACLGPFRKALDQARAWDQA